MLLNYQYEIFPNSQQTETLENWLSICRHTYNSALLDKTNAYKNEKRNLKRTDMQAIQTADKKRFPALKFGKHLSCHLCGKPQHSQHGQEPPLVEIHS